VASTKNGLFPNGAAAAHRDLMLLHRLHSAVASWERAIDFIGQDHIGKIGPFKKSNSRDPVICLPELLQCPYIRRHQAGVNWMD